MSFRLSVCHVRSCILSKRVNISSKKFSPSGSHTHLVFHTKRYGNIPTGTPELLQPICHLPGRFGEDRLGGLRDIAMQQKTEKNKNKN